MANKIKVGIIGCGGICNGKHYPTLKKMKDIEIVAFCDIIEERAQKLYDDYGNPDAKVYTDYKELLKDESIVAVHVLTPNRSHSFITIDALNAGKHVMCEKPMAKTAAEARAMVETAKKTGKVLTIGYQSRYRADSMYIKSACDAGELGEIYYGKAHAIRRRAVPTWGVFINEYEQGGGPLIDIGTHALDLTLWTMDNYKPKYCVGTTYHKLNSQTESANVFGQWKPEEFTVEDSAFGFIVMENGATINLESAWAINMTDTKEACTTICGTKAGAKMLDQGVLEINGVKHNQMYQTTPNLDGKGVAFYDAGGYSAGGQEAKQWINAILTGTQPTVLPEQAYCVTQILEGIYESARTGEAYYFNK